MRLKDGMKMNTNGHRFLFGMSLAFGLTAASAALGDGPLFPGAQCAAGDWPQSVAVSDLNGDQMSGLAVVNSISDNVSVLLGVGDGTFAAPRHNAAGDGPVSVAIGDQPRSVAIGDLNGDQTPDLAVSNSCCVWVLPGIGDATIAAAVPYAAGHIANSVAIGDLNGDDLPDLAEAVCHGSRSRRAVRPPASLNQGGVVAAANLGSIVLHDVSIIKGHSPDSQRLIVGFETVSIGDLIGLQFIISNGQQLQVLGRTVPGGDVDVVL